MNNTIKLSLLTMLLLNTNLLANEKLKDITVITATKTAQKLEDVTANISVITADEIEERQYTTVTQALNSFSGINFSANGGLGQTISLRVRGMASKRLLVLIDGVRYNDITGISGAPLAHLMINDIERIELIKGAGSGVWGADASAGVINIISKSAKDGFSVHASQEFGSFESSKTNAGLSYKNKNFYIKASHNNLHTEGFSAQLPKGKKLDELEDDAYSSETSNFKAGLNITKNDKLELSHTIIKATSQYDGFNAPNATDYATTDNSFSSLNYAHKDSFNELDVYAKKSEFDRKFVSSYGTSPYKGEVEEYGLNSKIPYMKDSFLLVGGEYKKFTHENKIDKSFDNRGFFITNSNKFAGGLGGTTILTESIRYDVYSDFDNKTTGKIGLKHIHSNIKGFSTSANYGTAYNIPTLNNLYDPMYGNKNISAEDTKSWDVSAEYKDLKLTYFNTKVKDMIDFYDPDGYMGPIKGTYANVTGTTKINGVEVEYKTDISDEFFLSTSYTYTSAKNTKKENLKRIPKNTVKMAIDYYALENLHLGIDGEYIGKRYSLDGEKGTQTGKYTLANFTANYSVNKNMTLYGRVDNITDKEYQTVDGYATSPRAFYAGMKLSY